MPHGRMQLILQVTRRFAVLLTLTVLAAGLSAAWPDPVLAPPWASSVVSAAPAVVAEDFAPTAGRRTVLSAGSRPITRRLPRPPSALSLELRLGRLSRAEVDFGPGGVVALERGRGEAVEVSTAAGAGRRVGREQGWRGGWRLLAVAGGPEPAAAFDGRRLEPPVSPRRVTLRAERGSVELGSMVATRARAGADLLFHRLAELHARTPLGRFPLGTGTDGQLRFERGWTGGFWPGSLWQAYDLSGQRALFRRWALEATLAHLGKERADSHDLGFMYSHSSVAAYERVCGRPRADVRRLCGRFRASGLRAARTLLGLWRSNATAGLLPTHRRPGCFDCASDDEADVIVDSMMNLSLLLWAGRQTDRPEYRQAVKRHADGVARVLIREDGSSAQAVHVRRSGAVGRQHTHQGAGDSSTWSRGQAWGLYGFAEVGSALGDRELLAVSERMALYVASRLPASGVPPYDYDAPVGAPEDTSAGVITAAGLFRLSEACRGLSGACGDEGRWRRLGARMLEASLERARSLPPIGFLGDQVYALDGPIGKRRAWDDRGEFIFGLDYALEAANLAGRVR